MATDRIGLAPFNDYIDRFLRGHIIGIPYPRMVAILGEPNYPDSCDGKVDAEWVLQDEEGHRLAVWNYKNGPVWRGLAPDDEAYQEMLERVDRWSCWWEDEVARGILRRLFNAAFFSD